MKLKRILSGLIGFPIVALILIYGNIYVIDILFAIVAIIAMHEYLNAFKNDNKPVKCIGYLSCLVIAFLHIIPKENLGYSLGISISIIIFSLFAKVIFTNMKTTVKDIMITFFGICYITLLIEFILVICLELVKKH